MKRWRLRDPLLLRYFASNLLVFSIPVIVLGYMMYQNAVINLRTEIEASNMSRLTQAKETTDQRMQELGRIAAKISHDPKLTPFMVRNQLGKGIEAIDELSRYMTLSSLPEELFLYFHGDSVVYSNTGLSNLRTITGSYYQYDAQEAEQFRDRLNTLDKPFISAVEEITFNYETSRMLTFMFPVKEFSPYGTVFYLVRESKLTGAVEHMLGNFQGRVMILDAQQRLVAGRNRGSDFPEQEMTTFLSEARTDGVYDLEHGGKKYSLAAVRSDATGWTFGVLMPQDQFFSRVVERRTFLGMLLVFVVLTGLGAALLLSLSQYRPIQKLTNHLLGRTPAGAGTRRGRNAFETIRHTIDDTFDQNRDLQERIDAQRPWMREMALVKLLKGDPIEAAELMGSLSPDVHQGDDRRCFVLLVSWEAEPQGRAVPRQGAARREELLHVLDAMELGAGRGYGVELIHDSAVACLVAMQPDWPGEPGAARRQQEEAVRRIHELLDERQIELPTIAVGGMCDGLAQANRSFIEASAAMEFRMKQGAGAVIFFEDIHRLQEQNAWFAVEEQVKFTHSIKLGDEKIALEALAAMFAAISGQQQSILLLKCMCIDIINTLFKTTSELRLPQFAAGIKELAEFSSVDRLYAQLRELVADICAEVERRKEHEHVRMRSDILAYIEENYRAYTLTLEQTADAFGLTPSYLSRLIKELTGVTFTDRVSELRMSEIKDRLVQTDKQIKDIIQEAGYLDVSTFVRKFKKHEGLTPGEYRKLHRLQDNPL